MIFENHRAKNTHNSLIYISFTQNHAISGKISQKIPNFSSHTYPQKLWTIKKGAKLPFESKI